MALTAKQEKFASEYVLYGNKSRAYKVAYDAENMSPESIHVEACNLSNDPNVSLRIRELEKIRAKTFETNMQETIEGIFQISKFDIAELYNEDGSMKNIHDIPKHVRVAISGIKVYEDMLEGTKIGETKEIKTFDKLAAFEKLMKHFGGYAEHNFQKSTELSREERESRKASLLSKANGTSKP